MSNQTNLDQLALIAIGILFLIGVLLGLIIGCRAVADAIRSIDDPSVELKGNMADWNKAGAIRAAILAGGSK